MPDNVGAGAVVPARAGRVEAKKVNPFVIVAVRVVRTYLQVFVALMGGALIAPSVIPPEMRGFVLMPVIQQAVVVAQLALLPALLSLFQNVLELLGELDVRMPTLRG